MRWEPHEALLGPVVEKARLAERSYPPGAEHQRHPHGGRRVAGVVAFGVHRVGDRSGHAGRAPAGDARLYRGLLQPERVGRRDRYPQLHRERCRRVHDIHGGLAVDARGRTVQRLDHELDDTQSADIGCRVPTQPEQHLAVAAGHGPGARARARADRDAGAHESGVDRVHERAIRDDLRGYGAAHGEDDLGYGRPLLRGVGILRRSELPRQRRPVPAEGNVLVDRERQSDRAEYGFEPVHQSHELGAAGHEVAVGGLPGPRRDDRHSRTVVVQRADQRVRQRRGVRLAADRGRHSAAGQGVLTCDDPARRDVDADVHGHEHVRARREVRVELHGQPALRRDSDGCEQHDLLGRHDHGSGRGDHGHADGGRPEPGPGLLHRVGAGDRDHGRQLHERAGQLPVEWWPGRSEPAWQHHADGDSQSRHVDCEDRQRHEVQPGRPHHVHDQGEQCRTVDGDQRDGHGSDSLAGDRGDMDVLGHSRVFLRRGLRRRQHIHHRHSAGGRDGHLHGHRDGVGEHRGRHRHHEHRDRGASGRDQRRELPALAGRGMLVQRE
ncbi:hypothetical protein MICRO8M_100022 [Microbacterium sp. 8M]|nr:hypothetical protein MICRO8M_100022 [Microbacterium sp. 8M]